jgi:DNA-binding CsgD family transcriptional regulator
MSDDVRVLELVERIYRAAVDRDAWRDVAGGLSHLFGDAAIWLAIQTPGAPTPSTVFPVGLAEEFASVLYKESAELSARLRRVGKEISERFVRMSEYSEAPTTPMIEEFLLPQGLAPESPIVHITTPEQAMLSSGIAVYRRKNGPEITNAQLATADRLVPHLARAIRIHGKLAESEHSQVALHEVIDRLPTGVLIVDERRCPVVTNRMADRIAASRDGFAIDDEGPKGSNRESTNNLRKLIDSAVRPEPGREMSGGGFMALERFSGRRPYPVLITPILGRSEHSSMTDAAAIIFISDPQIRDVSIVNVLMEMYGLTPAEAELAELLSQGRSLEEAAKARHVTLNTARSQLKQIFAKTNTNRQGELLQLVLSGVASVDSVSGIGDSAFHPDRLRNGRA